MTMDGTFRRQASHYLPGVIYNFNIADFKRRNIHLGHRVGDQDILELDRVLKGLAGTSALAQRVAGGTWQLVARREMHAEVQAMLGAYARTDHVWTGWRAEAKHKDRHAICECRIASDVRRAVRCLWTRVKASDELDSALDLLERNDYSLPVNQLLEASALGAVKREPWACVVTYPAATPLCGLCDGRRFLWSDGDGALYSGDGTCEACGADISISQIDEPRKD